MPQVKSEWEVAEIQVRYEPTKNPRITIRDGHTASRVFREIWDKDLITVQEQVAVLFLNQANRPLGYRFLNTGTIKSSQVDVRLLMTIALNCMATQIVIAHNHPSGSLRPSNKDLLITHQVSEACKFFDIHLLDHIILTKDKHYSFAMKGKLIGM
jgi:DNA repair protein RadC